jgi:glycosyltransferase involved in cell wall biosynthesis
MLADYPAILRMRIAFVTQPGHAVLPTLGSVEIEQRHVAERLAADDHQVMVLASAVGQQKRPDEIHDGVLYSFVPHFGVRYTRRLERLWWKPSPQRPIFGAWIHVLGYWIGVALRARRARAEVIWIANYSQAVPIIRRLNPTATIALHMHCDWLVLLDRRMVEKRLAHVDLVVGVSDGITDKIRARFPKLADRCVTLHNGVDVGTLVDVPVARNRNDGEVRILFVGRISPEKGVHVLLEAFHEVWRHNPHVRLTLVGGPSIARHEWELSDAPWTRGLDRFYAGDYSQMLEDSLDPEVAPQVTMTGFVPHEEIVEQYRRADLLVCPSIWDEPFAVPPLEGMAAGLPVVASAAGGFLECVEDGQTGFLVPPGDSQALAAAISSLVEDRELRERLGAAGRDRALELYSFDAMASALEDRVRAAVAQAVESGIAASRAEGPGRN